MQQTVTVTLDNSEYLHALIAGCMRRAAAREKGRQNYYGAIPANAEVIDLIGAVGEACVAKYLNEFWLGAGRFRGDDVGAFQVRSTTYDDGHLVLNKNDDDAKAFILACVSNGVGKLRGWIYASEGKREEYWTDKSGRGPAYYIPQSVLRPMESLLSATSDDF